MREIKFRAWEKDLKKMVYEGELCGYVEYDTNPVKAINLMLNGECADYIFMQYTGLKDKNGREIYEGDVIEFYDFWDEISGGNMEGKTRVGAVEYIGTGFRVTCPGDYEEDLFILKINDDELEIIGNVYENPELLGDDK